MRRLYAARVRNMHKSRKVKGMSYAAGNGKAIVLGDAGAWR
jgi:hypothetical protein